MRDIITFIIKTSRRFYYFVIRSIFILMREYNSQLYSHIKMAEMTEMIFDLVQTISILQVNVKFYTIEKKISITTHCKNIYLTTR